MKYNQKYNKIINILLEDMPNKRTPKELVWETLCSKWGVYLLIKEELLNGVPITVLVKLYCSKTEYMYIEYFFEYAIENNLLGKVIHKESIDLETLEDKLQNNNEQDFVQEVYDKCYAIDFTSMINNYMKKDNSNILINNIFENYIDEIYWQDLSLIEVEIVKRIK